MRPQTRVRPTVDTLESRELLSSLPVVPNPAAIHVEKGSGRGPSDTGGPSIGTLQGTASFSYKYIGDDFPTWAHELVRQEGDFTGTGNVKPFGRVTITPANYPSVIEGGVTAGAITSSLEGPIYGAINFDNAKGRVIGSIILQGDSWSRFTFQESRSRSMFLSNGQVSHGRVIARGTGTLTFPEGEPKFAPDTFSYSAVTVPFTINLRLQHR
jgi:hypothetical protein